MQKGNEVTRLFIDEEHQIAWINFSNGAQSYVWRSKEEAFNGIIEHFALRDISIVGFCAFMKKITLSGLPTSGKEIVTSFAAMLATISSDDLNKILFIENPTFRLHDAQPGNRHGWIEDGNGGLLRRVEIRSEGIRDVDQLLANKLIDEAGAEKLKRQIIKARLPAIREVDAFFN